MFLTRTLFLVSSRGRRCRDCMEINEEFVGREHSPRLRLRSHGEPEALGLTPVVSAESHLIRGHHVTISMPK